MEDEQIITLKLSECKEMLLKNWNLLSPETREMLRLLEIDGGKNE